MHIQTLYSLPLTYLLNLMVESHYLDCSSFYSNSWSQVVSMSPSDFLLLLLLSLPLLFFSFRIALNQLSFLKKKSDWIMKETLLNLYIDMGRNDILKILSLPIHGMVSISSFIRSSWISLGNDLQFSMYRTCLLLNLFLSIKCFFDTTVNEIGFLNFMFQLFAASI